MLLHLALGVIFVGDWPCCATLLMFHVSHRPSSQGLIKADMSIGWTPGNPSRAWEHRRLVKSCCKVIVAYFPLFPVSCHEFLITSRVLMRYETLCLPCLLAQLQAIKPFSHSTESIPQWYRSNCVCLIVMSSGPWHDNEQMTWHDKLRFVWYKIYSILLFQCHPMREGIWQGVITWAHLVLHVYVSNKLDPARNHWLSPSQLPAWYDNFVVT